MIQEERIQLRDQLFKEFKELKIIVNSKMNCYKIHNRKKIYQIINNNIQLQKKYNKYINEFRTEEEALYCLLHSDDFENHKCPNCDKICKFYNIQHPYYATCGDKNCIKKSITKDGSLEKRKKTNLERYGFEYAVQNEKVKAKTKKTNLERYGYECSFKNKEVKAKYKKTCLERFGVENSMQCKEVQKKGKETCLKKYGVENPFASKEIQKKIKQTNLEKYNVENGGVQKNIKNYDIYIDDNKFKEFIINAYNKKETFLTLSDISIIFNVISQSIKKRCEKLNLLDYFYIQESNLEIDFEQFLNENNIQYIRHYRKIYDNETNGNKEIDFLCNGNIGFEINDIWTHNSLKNNNYSNINTYKDKYYHRNKTILVKEYNIRLIHIWEWEIRNNNEWERLSRWIINLLNDNKIKIGARKTIIKEIPENIEREFLNNYHLQGYMKSLKCYGLYYNEELIQIISFTKPRYNKNYQWELLRLCTKYGCNVIGGAQKLLKNFIKNNNPKSIISYCNLDKFTGKIYEQMGFKLLRNIRPQIIWCNKYMKHFTQTSLNMIGADKMIGTNYGKGTNNEEIVSNHGYVPIYNCGINVYLLEKEIEK